MQHKRIYLACPYSHPDRVVRLARVWRANAEAANLMREGHVVMSPISHSHPIAVQCGLPLGFDFWQAQDEAFIDWCDAVYVVPADGWEESAGVQSEIALARKLDKEDVIL